MDRIKITEMKEKFETTRTKVGADGQKFQEKYISTKLVDIPLVKGWARFGHYMIDFVICQIVLAFIAGAILGVILVVTKVEFDEEQWDLYARLFTWLVLIPFYYFISEATMQRTIGKFATGAIVVNEYGEKPSLGQLLGRSYARIIPFEAFSCLSDRGWHDSASNTFVVKKAEMERIIQAYKEMEMSNFQDELQKMKAEGKI